jgi:hypothetical protein
MLVVGNITRGHVVKVEVPSNGLYIKNIFRVKGTIKNLLLDYFPWLLGTWIVCFEASFYKALNKIYCTGWQR